MPYEDERAGLEAIRRIAGSDIVNNFRASLLIQSGENPMQLPPFNPCPPGNTRKYVLAIDGSEVYASIPGALPCTEAGIVSLGVVIIDLEKLHALEQMPVSGAQNPRGIRATEQGETLGVMLPGRNAGRKDSATPKEWFREIINSELEKANLGDETSESFADTLYALLSNIDEDRKIKCPNSNCAASGIDLPKPLESKKCPQCKQPIWLTDGLRIHEQFVENESVKECHTRFRETLEILALVNSLRHLVKTESGCRAIGNIAFVMDGPLALFGTIAVLARAVRIELRRIQNILNNSMPNSNLLIMSGIKSGAFVEHAKELDLAPEPDSRIPNNHVWLPDNKYIRSHIISRLEDSKPWGELTYFGRPVILKTKAGQRLVLSLAQPEADPPLTQAPLPNILGDAIATAEPLGVGAHQFLPLRRAHAQAAIPLKLGTDLIKSLAS